MRATTLLLLAPLALLPLLSAGRPTAPAAGEQSARTYTIDPVHSGVLFRIEHLGVSAFWGRLGGLSGEFTIGEDGASSSVKVSIDAAAVDTASEDRDKHLRGPDFLNVKEYPEITFVSRKVSIEGETYTVTGDLTLLGKSRQVEVPMRRIGEGETPMGRRAGFEGELRIDRRDFGMNALEGPLGTEVRCILFFEGIAR